MKVNFEADPVWVVRVAVNHYISFLEEHNEDKSKTAALKKSNYRLMKEKAENMLEKLIDKKGKDYFVLSNLIDDGHFLSKLIEETDDYKRDVKIHKLNGYSGHGIYDKSEDMFTKCEEGHHRVALINILKHEYPNYYDKYEDFLEISSTDVRGLDDFITNNFVFV